MSIKKYFQILFFLAVISIAGCKPLQIIEHDNLKIIPAKFDDVTDTVNSANLNWRQYFHDKNLISLIDTALANNLDVKMAFQRIQAARSQVLFAKGALKPFVTGGTVAALNKFGTYTMDGAGNKGTEIYNGKDVPRHLPDYFVGFQASWEVDVWGKLRNQKKAATIRYLSTEQGRNVIITNLVADIATGYYELLGADNQILIIDETIRLQENALAIVRAQKEAAAANELAVKQFEARLLNLKTMKLQVLQERREIENRINFLSGRFPASIARDSIHFVKDLLVKPRTGVPSQLLQNRPDVKQAELELMAAKADIQAARASFYPSLNINGALGYQAFKTSLLFNTPESIAYAVMANLFAPLINKSAIKAEFNRASALQLELLYNYQQKIMNAYTEVYNEVSRINKLEQAYQTKETEVNMLSQAVDISQELFKTGMATYLEVLIAQQNTLQSRIELVNIRQSQFVSSINMYKALGGGWK